jgi:hypothetical protein
LSATDRRSRHRLVARLTGNADDREDNPSVDAKGRAGAHPANRLAQYVDLRHQQIRTGVAQFTVKKKKVPPGTRLRR